MDETAVKSFLECVGGIGMHSETSEPIISNYFDVPKIRELPFLGRMVSCTGLGDFGVEVDIYAALCGSAS